MCKFVFVLHIWFTLCCGSLDWCPADRCILGYNVSKGYQVKKVVRGWFLWQREFKGNRGKSELTHWFPNGNSLKGNFRIFIKIPLRFLPKGQIGIKSVYGNGLPLNKWFRCCSARLLFRPRHLTRFSKWGFYSNCFFLGFFFHIYKFYTKYPSEPDIDLHINHQQYPDHVDCCTVLASAWWLGTVSGVWDMAFPSRLVPACVQGPDSIYRYRLTSIGNPTVEIIRS